MALTIMADDRAIRRKRPRPRKGLGRFGQHGATSAARPDRGRSVSGKQEGGSKEGTWHRTEEACSTGNGLTGEQHVRLAERTSAATTRTGERSARSTRRCVSAAATTPRPPPTRTAGTGPMPICSRPTPPTIPRSAARSAAAPATKWPTTATPAGSSPHWPTTASAPAPGCRCSPTMPSANRVVEQEFMRWADAISLPEKLRTMRMARAESGEAFCYVGGQSEGGFAGEARSAAVRGRSGGHARLDAAVLWRQCRRRDRLRRPGQSDRVPRAEEPSGRYVDAVFARLRSRSRPRR